MRNTQYEGLVRKSAGYETLKKYADFSKEEGVEVTEKTITKYVGVILWQVGNQTFDNAEEIVRGIVAKDLGLGKVDGGVNE